MINNRNDQSNDLISKIFLLSEITDIIDPEF